jgi:hypothetical protein
VRKVGSCVLAFAVLPALAGAPPAFVRSFLHDRMGFSNHDLSEVADGRPVARLIHTDSAIDVSVFGAVRIAVPPDAFIDQLRDIQSYERRLGVLQAGKFHDPPDLSDLSSLTLDPSDVDALEHCQPGDCDVQLTTDAMTAFRNDARLPGDAARDRINADFRDMLLGVLTRYRDGGIGALGTYDDRRAPLSLLGEFKALDALHAVPAELTTLVQRVLDGPRAPLGDAEEFFYWNKGEFGMKPTTRVNRVVIFPVAAAGARPDGIRYAVATVQLYASHYFSATFELRTIVDDEAQPGKACYLLYTSRSRVNGLTGFVGSFIRPIAKSRARSGMERYLLNTRKAVEATYAASSRAAPPS